MERAEILNAIENLKARLDELYDLSQERFLTAEEMEEMDAVFEAIGRVKLELVEKPLTLYFENPKRR